MNREKFIYLKRSWKLVRGFSCIKLTVQKEISTFKFKPIRNNKKNFKRLVLWNVMKLINK